MMIKNQMNQIIDGIYFEKLSTIITNLQQWEKNKNNTIHEVYGESFFNLLARLQHNSKELNLEMTQFLKILNMQYSFLCKLRKQDRVIEISPIYKEFKEFNDEFTLIKNSLLQLNDYLGKFIGVTNYQFTQLKRIYDEVEQIKNRYQLYKNKLNAQFNQRKDLIYSKKNVKKTFQLTKMIEILSDIAKQKNYYNDLSSKLYAILYREVVSKQKLYKDICDNIQFISKLYQKSFQRDILTEIKFYFKDKLQTNIKHEKILLQNSKLDLNISQSAFKQIEQKFYQYFNQFLNQITITSWNIIFSTKQKQDQDATKQMSTNLILTFDHKLVFSPQEKKILLRQINLEDIKIYKANKDGRFEVKNKKNKEKFYILFPKVENEDEFFLHYQQIAQKV